MRIFQRQDELNGGQAAHRWESGVRLSNFYGIELADFAAETAKLSLWIAEYQMNQRFKSLFGEAPPDFPLQQGGNITHGNALRLDWSEACAPSDDEGIETYLVGNPPYLGSTWQNANQKSDMGHVFSPFTKTYKNLDYVSAWYLKGAEYSAGQNAQCAFVATNSICQGYSVGLLWPLIFNLGVEIGFAHQSFKWKNLAANNAGVTCVIVGMRPVSEQQKTLFHDGIARQVKDIGPYLIEMPNIIVNKASRPLNNLPLMEYGNKPTDGGNFILSPQEKNELLERHPESKSLIRRFYGSQELIKGIERWCLWIKDEDLDLAHSIPPISERIESVREFRSNSTAKSTRDYSVYAHRFRQVQGNHDAEHCIVIPRVSSENRPYLPVDLITDGSIIQDRAFAIYDGPIWIMSIIASRLHQQWIATVCVRMRSDFSYSNTLGYNTFPIPKLTEEEKQALETHAWNIIAAREAHPGKTIAWLYDAKTMPDNLLSAHQALDDTLEKIYIGRPFKNDTERLEHLFKRYAEMTANNKDAANA